MPFLDSLVASTHSGDIDDEDTDQNERNNGKDQSSNSNTVAARSIGAIAGANIFVRVTVRPIFAVFTVGIVETFNAGSGGKIASRSRSRAIVIKKTSRYALTELRRASSELSHFSSPVIMRAVVSAGAFYAATLSDVAVRGTRVLAMFIQSTIVNA